jgi:hypothetical protein
MASRIHVVQRSDTGGVGTKDGSWRENASAEDLILEAWSQGFVSTLSILSVSVSQPSPEASCLPFRAISWLEML